MPPKYNPPEELWASEIEDRSPSFKIHNKKHLAFAAIQHHIYAYPRGGKVYKLGEDNEWELQYELKVNNKCVACGEVIEHLNQSYRVNYYSHHEHARLAHRHCAFPAGTDYLTRPDLTVYLTDEEKLRRK